MSPSSSTKLSRELSAEGPFDTGVGRKRDGVSEVRSHEAMDTLNADLRLASTVQ